MKFFLDTEFIESGPDRPIQLVSIGLVAEDGEEWYAESSAVSWQWASPWADKYIKSQLTTEGMTRRQIREGVRDYIGARIPEFWGYCCAYDWVVFAQLFGSLLALPPTWPPWCHDLRQWADERGLTVPEQTEQRRHALDDARWIKRVYEELSGAVGVDKGAKE